MRFPIDPALGKLTDDWAAEAQVYRLGAGETAVTSQTREFCVDEHEWDEILSSLQVNM